MVSFHTSLTEELISKVELTGVVLQRRALQNTFMKQLQVFRRQFLSL